MTSCRSEAARSVSTRRSQCAGAPAVVALCVESRRRRALAVRVRLGRAECAPTACCNMSRIRPPHLSELDSRDPARRTGGGGGSRSGHVGHRGAGRIAGVGASPDGAPARDRLSQWRVPRARCRACAPTRGSSTSPSTRSHSCSPIPTTRSGSLVGSTTGVRRGRSVDARPGAVGERDAAGARRARFRLRPDLSRCQRYEAVGSGRAKRVRAAHRHVHGGCMFPSYSPARGGLPPCSPP